MAHPLITAALALLAVGAASASTNASNTTIIPSTEMDTTTEPPIPRASVSTVAGELKIKAFDVAFVDLSEEPAFEDGECTAFGLCSGLSEAKADSKRRDDATNAKMDKAIAAISKAAADQKAALEETMAADKKALSDTMNTNKQEASKARSDLDKRLTKAITDARSDFKVADEAVVASMNTKLTKLSSDLNKAISQASSRSQQELSDLTTAVTANKASASRALASAVAALNAKDTSLSQSLSSIGAAATANGKAVAANKATAAAAQQATATLRAAVVEMCVAMDRLFRNNKCEAVPGLSPSLPASGCKQVLQEKLPSGGYYVKHPGSSRVSRVFCDNSYSGGGWELLHKIDGSSSHFRYDSGYWTSGSNVYRETVMNGNWGENVKAWGYNYGRYSEIRLRWRDPHDGGQWTWTNPSGWSSGRSPQSYFNSGRHICCSRVSEVEQRMEWRNSGGRFSNQGCAGRLAIAQCTSSVSCSRWGFHWNNECRKMANGMSLFLRTGWLSTVPEAEWRAWFELVKRGRAEGPGSPYYVSELGLQTVACCNSPDNVRGCLGPKCTTLGVPPYTLFEDDISKLLEYLPLFDKVYIGTTYSYGTDWGNHTSIMEYARVQARVGKAFLERFGDTAGVNWAWYLTMEASLPEMGTSAIQAAGVADFLEASMSALHAVKPMSFLWSPSNGDFTPNATTRGRIEARLESVLCNVSHPLALHFQDWLGQSTTFEFPFFYNYSQQFSCEADTVPTYQMLQRIVSRCPDRLTEAKVNVELFAERLNNGKKGEDNGANIINADPREVADRLQCYSRHNLSLGCSWAIPHWYGIWSFANETVYRPY